MATDFPDGGIDQDEFIRYLAMIYVNSGGVVSHLARHIGAEGIRPGSDNSEATPRQLIVIADTCIMAAVSVLQSLYTVQPDGERPDIDPADIFQEHSENLWEAGKACRALLYEKGVAEQLSFENLPADAETLARKIMQHRTLLFEEEGEA